MSNVTEPLRAAAPSLPASALLSERIEALRRRHVQVAVLTGLALTVVVCLELLALAMFIDWWRNLP